MEELKYTKAPKQTYKTARHFTNVARARVGKPPIIKRNTEAQTLFYDRCKLIDFFKQVVNNEHRTTYFTHKMDESDAKKANSAVGKLIKDFYLRCDNNMDKAKKVIEWFARDDYWRAEVNNYNPMVCFSRKTVIDYENKDSVGKKGGGKRYE